jgi:pimeloyl-ACP methyl ester carboxylesterase
VAQPLALIYPSFPRTLDALSLWQRYKRTQERAAQTFAALAALAAQSEALAAQHAALAAEHGKGRRLLVAHDWGAIIAWIFALRNPGVLDGLIIMNVPHPRVFRDVLKTSWAQKKKSWYVAFFQLPWLPEALLGARGAEAIGKAFSDMAIDKSAFPPAVTDHYRANARQPGALTAMVNYYRANFPNVLEEPVVPLTVPTLLLWGEEDSALDIALTEGYGPLVADFTLQCFPDVSHWVQQEAPAAVNAAMRDWLGTKLG